MGDFRQKIAVACQGGGTHAAFEVGVLNEILRDIYEQDRFDLVGLSGTSAGALCALMVWYGLAPRTSVRSCRSAGTSQRTARGWPGKPETLDNRVVQECIDASADHRRERARKPTRKQVNRGIAHAPIGRRQAKPLALIRVAEALESVNVRRQVLDAHSPTDFAPEVEQSKSLLFAHGTPAKAPIPANGFEDEGRKHIEKVAVGNPEAAVQLVHALKRTSTPITAVALSISVRN